MDLQVLADLDAVMKRISDGTPVDPETSSRIEERANRITEEIRHTRSGYYDCLYVALAEREGCELIPADQKSINNLAPHFPFILPLETLP